MAEEAENIDVLIDAYLDGRMEPSQRSKFEERMKNDPQLNAQVMSATHAVALVQKALGAIVPGNEFEDSVNSKILSITQSGYNFAPASSNSNQLSKDDPDAKLLGDPEEAREHRRLLILGIIAALLFALAAGMVLSTIKSGLQKPPPEAPASKER